MFSSQIKSTVWEEASTSSEYSTEYKGRPDLTEQPLFLDTVTMFNDTKP